MKSFRTGLIAILASCALITSGCNRAPDGPARYELSGTVTYQGKPVPAGEIMFIPDSSQGNRGPGAVTFIKEGKFVTRPGKGITPGPTKVTISGVDRVAGEENIDSSELFPPYEMEIDLEAKDASVEIEIPVKN